MTKTRPLQLLRERVTDAWINNCYPDLPGPDDPELVVVPLSHFPVWLMAARDHPLSGAQSLSSGDLERFPSLALPKGELPTFERVLRAQGLWTSPLRMRRYSPADWQSRCADEVTMSFGNTVSLPLTPHLVPLDWNLGLIEQLRRRVAALCSRHHVMKPLN